MIRLRHLFVTALICAVILTGIAFGWFQPLDNALRDFRFSIASRQASGDIVFVEIGSNDMAAAGNASRARSVYADAIDWLVEAGAEIVVLDVALRDTLGYFDDNALATSLTRANGAARTVALPVMTEGGDRILQLPLDRFAAVAPPVFADSVPDADNVFRGYRTRFVHEGWVFESLATALSPERRISERRFLIDFGIDVSSIPRFSIADINAGRVDPEQFAGKKIVIGLSDSSVQNSVVTPRYGVLPITATQLLAAETVLQDRMLVEVGMPPLMVIVVLVGLVFAFLRSRMSVVSAVAGSLAYAAMLEFTAMALHQHAGLLLNTTAIHLAQAGFLLSAFWHELEARGRSLTSAARERDSTRGILARVIADNFDGVIVVDHTGTIRAASRLAEELIATGLRGQNYTDVLPEPFKAAIARAIESGKTTDSVSEEIASCDGEIRTIDYVVTLSAVGEAEVSGEAAGRVACLTFRDVTERKAVEEQLTFLAQHDALTGAASRIKFVESVNRQLGTPTTRARGVSVFLVGLTRLKVVNDTLGHAYGNSLLKQVVSRLQLMAPLGVGRLEGNSFAVLREGILSDEDGAKFAEGIIETLSRPYALEGHHAIVGACVGMTDTDLSGSNAEVLLSHASLALSIATDIPGNTAVTFSREMETRIKNKQDMEVALRAALEKGEFTVHYQPQVDLDSGEIIGVEALTRWTHSELGNVSPAEFIPAAEETGLIIDLGRWVLKTACSELAKWPKPVRLSVNVSPMQFEYGDIVADVLDALAESGLAADRLDIEITESLLVTETCHVSAQLTQLRKHGVGVALDDFGTGYSSLSYLGRLPVDKIKIDQSFVRGLPADNEATAIVRAVLMLSESLGKDVVAEGIETQDQAWLLRLAGCRTGQGYLFARPAPASEILELLSDQMDVRSQRLRIG